MPINPMTRFIIEAAKDVLGRHVVVKTSRANPDEFTVHDMSGFRPTADTPYPAPLSAPDLAAVMARANELRDAEPTLTIAPPVPNAPAAPDALATLSVLVSNLAAEIAALKARL